MSLDIPPRDENMRIKKWICVKSWLAFGLILSLIMPSALLAGSTAAPSTDIPAASQDDFPWWDCGWEYRRPVTIDNADNTKDLEGYPMLVKVLFKDHMNLNFSDLRFAQYNSSSGQNQELCHWMENKTDGVSAYVWVNVSCIKASETATIHMYYGNPSAGPASDGDGTFDFFDDFESGTLKDGWTFWNPGGDDGYSLTERPGWLRIKVVGTSDTWESVNSAPFMYWAHPSPGTDFAVQTREDGTGVGASSRHSFLAYIRDFNQGSYNKGYWGAYTSTTSCKFEADGFRGNTAQTGAAVHYLRFTKEASELYYDWSVDRLNWSNGGSYTLPSPPNHWGLGGKSWSTGGGFNADFDYFIVRRYADPEPAFAIGAEERPFKFISASCSNQHPNEGEPVTMNVTFNNPTDVPISINISFHVGETFGEAKLLSAKEASLSPRGDTLVQGSWTAAGGKTVLWAVLDRSILASFELSVNWFPTLDYIPDQRLMQDQPFQLRITAGDKGGEPLVWKEDCPLFDFSRTNSTAAEISLMPTNDQIGTYQANVTVTDPHNCTAGRSFRLFVENQNDPPWLEHIPDLVACEDALYTRRFNATDPDLKWGDTLVFSDDSPLFDMDPVGGNFSFTPTNEQVGRYFIEISVRDNQSAAFSRAFNLTVQNANDPPSIEAIPPQTATQGKLWQVMARASDPDQATPEGDRLRFGDDSPLFDINAESGLITFTPGNKDVGPKSCNITVTDLAGAACSTKLLLSVLNVNDPPALDAIPDQTATEEAAFEYTVRASDPDVPLGLDNLTFSDDSALFDIDPKSGRFAFAPANAQVGRHTVKITVKDESGAAASRAFLLTVLNVNDPPFNVSITSISPGARFRETDTVWLNGTGSDEDAGDRLAFTWVENEFELGKGKSIQVRLGPGDHLIRLEVSDGNATVTAEASFKISRAVKEQVTVQNDWWLPLVAVVLIAAAVAGAFLAMRRSKRREPEAPPESGAAAPPVPSVVVPPPAAGDPDKRDRARKAISSAEDAIAEALEEGADTAAAMESLDIAKDFFKDGDYDEAATYAGEAAAALKQAGEKPADEKPGPGKLACPECGENLQPDWPTCPVCGHRTR